MKGLSKEQIDKLLAKEVAKNTPRPRRHQSGPLRWYDYEMRCLSRRCGSPTYCKVEGVAYCQMHALSRLNDIAVELIDKIRKGAHDG